MFQLLEEVKEAKTIGISGHIRPDGDCVGATAALYLFLKEKMPEVRIDWFLEKPPAVFDSLPGVAELKTDFATDVEQYDVFFCVDCSADRLGRAESMFAEAHKKINIDHHISNTGCGDVNYIVPTTGSASELVYDLIGEDNLNKDLAEVLYIGIIHDTGVFQYSNTSSRTMEKGAKLIQFGFPYPKLITETFYEKTYAQTQMLGRALLESIRFMDGRCIVSCIDRKTMDFYQALPSDLDGIVNQLLNIKGIDCAIFMYEIGTLEYKVSLRSNEKIDVSKVASFFSGGGHMRAAGCTMKGTFHDVVNNISLQLEKQFEQQ